MAKELKAYSKIWNIGIDCLICVTGEYHPG